MRKVTKRELELLTDKHGKFIKQALAGIPFERGPNRSHQYHSAVALSGPPRVITTTWSTSRKALITALTSTNSVVGISNGNVTRRKK